MPSQDRHDRLYFLAKDPNWTFLWWEVSQETKRRIAAALGVEPHEMGRRLRVHDITDVHFDGSNAHAFFEISVNQEADHWYLHLDSPGRIYCAEFGFCAGLEFHVAIRSAALFRPPGYASSRFGEGFSTIDLD